MNNEQWGYLPFTPNCDYETDPNTGWGGFTDHRYGKSFQTDEEYSDFLKKYPTPADWDNEEDIF